MLEYVQAPSEVNALGEFVDGVQMDEEVHGGDDDDDEEEDNEEDEMDQELMLRNKAASKVQRPLPFARVSFSNPTSVLLGIAPAILR